MQQVVIATHNLGKVEEFKSLMNELGLEFTCLSDYPPIPEPEENAARLQPMLESRQNIMPRKRESFVWRMILVWKF